LAGKSVPLKTPLCWARKLGNRTALHTSSVVSAISLILGDTAKAKAILTLYNYKSAFLATSLQ